MSTPSGKKDAILNAALKLFAEQGFHAAPMSQIAETADIGVGTIYRYYKNKEELIDGLYLEVRRRMAEEIIKGQDTSAPVKHEFNRSMKNLIRYLVMHPEEIQFSNQYEHSPFITDATRREVEKTVSPLADLLLRGREEKTLKDLPFPMLMSMFSGASMGLLNVCLRKKTAGTLLNEGIAAIWDMLTRKNEEGV